MADSVFRVQFARNNHLFWVLRSNFTSNFLESGSVVKIIETKGFQLAYVTPNNLAYDDASGAPVVADFFNLAF